VDGKIYAVGGLARRKGGTGLKIADEVEAYDPSIGAWQRVGRMPDPRWGIGAAVVEGRIHLVGGGRSLVLAASHHVDVYDPRQLTYWSDVAAHSPGSFGSQWRTDVCVVNDAFEAAAVEAVLHTDGGDFARSLVVGGGEQKTLQDVVGAMQVQGKGALELRSDRPLRLSGRTYSDGGNGSFGQSCAFQTMDDGFVAFEEAWLVGLRQEEGLFRTNLNFANTGIRIATMAVRLFSCDGTHLCTLPVVLDRPGDSEQIIGAFASEECGAPDLGWGYARVLVVSGAGVRISASVIDSLTNDATTVVGVR
jgi:hypothetical protein